MRRGFVFAVLACTLWACGADPGGEGPEVGRSEDATRNSTGPSGDRAADRSGDATRDRPRDPDSIRDCIEPTPACIEARADLRACRQRVEAACAPIEVRLRACRQNASTGTTRDRDDCARIARKLHACQATCEDLEARAERICAPPRDACRAAREDAAACMEGFRDCRSGAEELRDCLVRAEAACDPTTATRPPAFCSDVEAHCLRLAARNSNCLATCYGLLQEAHEACRGDAPQPGTSRPRPDRGDDAGDDGSDGGDGRPTRTPDPTTGSRPPRR